MIIIRFIQFLPYSAEILGFISLGMIASFLSLPLASFAATINLQIIEDASGKTVPARVLLCAADGTCYYPDDAVLLKIANDVWFMSSGESQFSVPSGEALLRVERGKEYLRVKESINIPTTGSLSHKVILKRWVNMSERGYQCGENHLHRAPEDVAALCAAEDLDYGTVLQWWNRPRFGVPEGSGHLRDLNFAGITIPTSVYDVEVEEAWGALYLINMPNPFPFLNDPHMPNLPAAKYGREHDALNCYQSGWSREVLIDALLGYVDVVNVCNNNFHMHRFQPRSFYSNLLNVKGFPVYPDTPEGMMRMNEDTYYRLLNCGLKLAAGAGSATGAKEVPVGYDRAYVRVANSGGHEEFIEAWRTGKNFVTNGPMLLFRSTNGLRPGDSLNVRKPAKLKFDIEVDSDSPLSTVEIVVNGQVAKSFNIAEGKKKFVATATLEFSQSSWVCARCTDTDKLLTDDELAAYDGPPTKFTQKPCRLRFAHTSPIYIKIDGQDIVVEKSVREGLKMIDAFEKFSRENVGPKYREMISNAINKARAILLHKLNAKS